MSAPSDDDVTTELVGQRALAPPTSAAWTAVVLAGPDEGRSFRIDDAAVRRALIGSSPTCDVRLTDRTVSRRHAALEGDESSMRVVDLGSRNGTWVGGVRVRDAYLDGDPVITVGDTTIRMHSDGVQRAVEASTEARFHRVIGVSAEMRALYPFFRRVAETDVAVLIEGETGTGKEVLAESLHEASERRSGPFVVLDCTTVSPQLLEAELFGHERGAFTGADVARAGLFESASGGTLFIDEIGDLDLGLQAKLLRALERKEVRRVGSNRWLQLDVRVIAATRRNLDREVQAQRFRDDLYYRLAVARVELPPLRKRRGDISFLVHFFWRKMGGDSGGLTPDVVQRFEAHDWPGNIRELYNAVVRQRALGDFDLHGGARGEIPSDADFLSAIVLEREVLPRARQRVVQEFERRYVAHMLAAHGGNVTHAAAASGVGRRYFQMVRAKL